MTKFIISDHAYERFYERFNHLDLSIQSLLNDAFPFAGQKGSQYLLINKDYDAVFPIVVDNKGHTVKTILTLKQAQANLSLNTKIFFELEKKLEIIQPNKEKEENNNKLKVLAREYLEKYGCCPSVQERKELTKQIKNILPISNKQFDNFFIGEITRIIRESNKSLIK